MNPVEQKKILVIDDSEENRLILTELCKSLGYAPSETENLLNLT
jgi:CheY-like chemotaxis protein